MNKKVEENENAVWSESNAKKYSEDSKNYPEDLKTYPEDLILSDRAASFSESIISDAIDEVNGKFEKQDIGQSLQILNFLKEKSSKIISKLCHRKLFNKRKFIRNRTHSNIHHGITRITGITNSKWQGRQSRRLGNGLFIERCH